MVLSPLVAVLAIALVSGCAAPPPDDEVVQGAGALSGLPSAPTAADESDVDPARLEKVRAIKEAYEAARELREVAPPPSDQDYFARIFATHRIFELRGLPSGLPNPLYVIEWNAQTESALVSAALGVSGRMRYVSFEDLVGRGAQRKRFGFAAWPASDTSGPPRWVTWTRADRLVEVFKSR